jgi:hypothetical protein
MSDYLSKKALLESLKTRRSMHRTSMPYDMGIGFICEMLIAELESGRLDIPSPVEERLRDALESTLSALERLSSGLPVANLDEVIAYAITTLSTSPSTPTSAEGRYRAALEQLIEDYERRLRSAITMIDDPNTPSEQRIRVHGNKEAYRTFIHELQALSTTTEPTGAERVREKFENLEKYFCGDEQRAEDYKNGMLWVIESYRLVIPGINAPEKEDGD